MLETEPNDKETASERSGGDSSPHVNTPAASPAGRTGGDLERAEGSVPAGDAAQPAGDGPAGPGKRSGRGEASGAKRARKAPGDAAPDETATVGDVPDSGGERAETAPAKRRRPSTRARRAAGPPPEQPGEPSGAGPASAPSATAAPGPETSAAQAQGSEPSATAGAPAEPAGPSDMAGSAASESTAPEPSRARRRSAGRVSAGRGRASRHADEAAASTSAEADRPAAPPAGGAEVTSAPPRGKRASRPSGTGAADAAAGGPAPAAAGGPLQPAGPAPFASPFPAGGAAASAAEEEQAPGRPGVPVATFQPPQIIFQPPSPDAAPAEPERGGSAQQAAPAEPEEPPAAQEEGEEEGGRRRRRRSGRARGRGGEGEQSAEAGEAGPEAGESGPAAAPAQAAEDGAGARPPAEEEAEEEDEASGSRRRRRRRRRGSGDADQAGPDEPPNTVVHVRPARAAEDARGEVKTVRGSTRLEAKRQRRREGREMGRRRPPIVTESEFLARREAVDRVMAIRQRGDRTQIGVLEDGVLVEHYVDKSTHQSFVGNVYLGKVQNVLPSMEAAFVDIGKGRNAVLYAGEVNFDASGLEGESKRIESALKSGQSVLVQVTKDPVGHKGARLTSQVSLPGRYLVYVPGGSMMGISRKLPDKERARLKQILKQVMPDGAGVIVRTAAEGASEEELARDVARLSAQWESISRKAKSASAPELLYSEPDLTIRVVRDIFNEDFSKLIVAGEEGWNLVDEYVGYVAPHLAERVERWTGEDDLFTRYRIDEQIAKGLDRKVWLPSGGSLVIDKTEAMTVIDVNTGKFTGQGGNLEETVTRNNLEAAEEIVRQLRLRDIGGIIVIDFIDMVLESNRDLVLRRLLECLARDRTKHQVAEVTSLGLVQMTRKRVGSGLLEAFSQPCECCNGRGVVVSLDFADQAAGADRSRGDGRAGDGRPAKEGRPSRNGKAPDRRPHPEPAAAEAVGSGAAAETGAPEAPAEQAPATKGAGPAASAEQGALAEQETPAARQAPAGRAAAKAGGDGEAAGAAAGPATAGGAELAGGAAAEVPHVAVRVATSPPSGGRRRRASRQPGPPDIPADEAEPVPPQAVLSGPEEGRNAQPEQPGPGVGVAANGLAGAADSPAAPDQSPGEKEHPGPEPSHGAATAAEG